MDRNIRLDYYKIFLSILVITIHIPYIYTGWESVGRYIPNVIARIAVPSFFILNGYFLTKKLDDPQALKRYLIHLFVIYTTWFIVYLRPYMFQTNNMDLIPNFKILEILELYFWGYFHLWYLPALIIGIGILLLIKKLFSNDSVILISAIILFTGGCILEPLTNTLYAARNGFFMGFPFVALGYWLYKKDIKKINGKYIIVMVVISFVLLMLEATYAKVPSGRDFYISLLLFCPASILFFLKYPKSNNNIFFGKYINSLSSAIYFSHVYIIFISFTAFDVTPIARFAIVLFVTIVVSLFIIFINKYIKIFL